MCCYATNLLFLTLQHQQMGVVNFLLVYCGRNSLSSYVTQFETNHIRFFCFGVFPSEFYCILRVQQNLKLLKSSWNTDDQPILLLTQQTVNLIWQFIRRLIRLIQEIQLFIISSAVDWISNSKRLKGKYYIVMHKMNQIIDISICNRYVKAHWYVIRMYKFQFIYSKLADIFITFSEKKSSSILVRFSFGICLIIGKGSQFIKNFLWWRCQEKFSPRR